MPEQPLYHGHQVELGESVRPMESPTVGLQAAQQAARRGADTLGGITDQFFQIRDFGQQQRMEAQLREQTADFDREFTRRSAIAPGASGSIYKEDGTLDENALDDLVFDYGERLSQIRGDFTDPAKAIEADAMRQQNIERLRTRAWGHATQQEIANTRRAFDDNLRLALTTRNYPEAIASVEAAVKNGLISRTQGEEKIRTINHDTMAEEAERLLSADPRQLHSLLTKGTFEGVLSPLEQQKLRDRLRRLGEQKKMAMLKTYATAGSNGGGTKSTKGQRKPEELIGFLTEQQAAWYYAVQSGQFADYKRTITGGAIEEAACAPIDIAPEDYEAWREHYLTVYEHLGLDTSFLNRQLKLAEDRNKALATPTIPLKDLLDRAQRDGHLYNQKTYDEEAKAYEDEKGWEKGGTWRNKHGGSFNIYQLDSGKVARDKYLENGLKPKIADDIRADVSQRFLTWRTFHPDGRQADILTQQEKLQELIQDATGNKAFALTDRSNGVAQEIEAARQAQHNKFNDWVEKNPRNVHVGGAAAIPAGTKCKLGYDTDARKPFGILVPASKAAGLDLKKSAIRFTYGNGTFGTLPIVGTCEGDAPKLTAAVAEEFYADPNASDDVEYRIIGIDGSTELMQPEPEDKAPAAKGYEGIELGGLREHLPAITAAARRYGIEPELMIAIAMQETGRGSSSAFRNKRNAFGITGSAMSPRSFASIEEGAEYTAKLLKNRYLDKGLTTIDAIGRVYAPAGAANDPYNQNPSWVRNVTKFYNQLKNS